MFCRNCGKQAIIRFCLGGLLVVIGSFLIGCGASGSNSGNGGSGSGPTPTVTSVSASCGAGSVPVNQTDQCTATVQGTGNFDPSVNWSVSGTAGGNSTVGTMNAAGLYTAPTSVPTPFTVTLTATSAANSSVSDSVSVTIAGTIASTTQTVSAVSGGTITLPDGSSVTIAAGVLPADETVTLSEVSILPNTPPNPAIASVGAGLIVSFSDPIQFSSAITKGMGTRASLRAADAGTATSAIQFSLNTSSYDPSLLQNVESSTPFADFANTSGADNFMGLLGGFVSASNAIVAGTDSLLVGGLSGVKSIAFGTANLVSGAVHFFQAGSRLTFDPSTSQWKSYSGCPSGKTLLAVHGMLSSVENSFSPSAVSQIEKDGGYDNIVGFDYNWLQGINQSGAQLASFLNDLGDCNISSLDVEAHSEGVPVSISGITQSVTKVSHMIAIGGPIMGTPAADDVHVLETIILDWTGIDLPVGTADLATVLTSPFISDLTTTSGTLAALRSTLASDNNAPEIIVVGGDKPQVVNPLTGSDQNVSLLSAGMGTDNFDGVVPWTSALAFDSGLKVYPLVSPLSLFESLGHNDLVSNSQLEAAIGQQIEAATAPSLSCTSSVSNCEGAQGTTFSFDGRGFSPEPTAVQVFQQDSSGDVIQVPAALQDSGGNVTWSITPMCSDPTGSFSVIPFDMGESLAGNDVMQTIDAGTCSGTNPNPVPSISSLSPASLPVGSAPQTLTVVGTGFLSNSSVTFNGVSHPPSIISSTELSIPLSSSDLATLGSYPVVVTNPTPGGGGSNSFEFSVSGAVSGTVTISPTAVTIPAEGTQTFTASVVGSSDGVTWTVQEGATGGNVVNATPTSAIYVPPTSTGTFHVVATNADDSSESAVATVSVVPAIGLTVLHTFDPSQGDGVDPVGELLQASDGDFYGMTYAGGSADSGTAFKIDSSGNFLTLASFESSGPAGPDAGFIQASDGNLYGTSFYGGTGGRGTVFKMDTSGDVAVLHSFADADEGANPYPALIQAANGNFYGTTYYGGPANAGTTFKIDSSGNVMFLHSFANNEGGALYAGLIQASDGNFYGTAYYGGASGGLGDGTVYTMNASGTVTVIHSFSGSDGTEPFAALVQGSDGYLYGTTIGGGSYGYGTVFKVDTTGNLTVLHSFSGGEDGAGPHAELIQGTDGDFYGTTSGGGASGQGTIFRMDSAGDVTVLHSFSNADAGYVTTGVIEGADGNLYGTGQGGSKGSGIVYRLSLAAFLTGAAQTKRESSGSIYRR